MEQQEKLHWHIPDSTHVEVAELATTIAQSRGVQIQDYFKLDYTALGDPFDLPDMKLAIDHLMLVHQRQGRVVVYGDYDIDGLTATALLKDALTQFGFDVTSYIPDRFEEGYGLHAQALKKLHAEGADTIVTVDCGISATDTIAEAVNDGLNIIVTDHHAVPEVEPSGAVALINPLRKQNKYKECSLAGVGVAFALVRALQSRNLEKMPFGQEKWLLDLVALGTICDVVPLTGENRVLASYGLQVARRSRRAGIRALAKVSNTSLDSLSASDFGFRFGPRLNAAGRLEHARVALELLEATEYDQAYLAAEHLDELNRERRNTTEQIQAAAYRESEQYSTDQILVLSSLDWTHGVVGLVASRVAERFGKPTIILQEEGEFSKGSARSVGTFSIIDAIRKQAPLLERYGGHQAAAGITLRTDKIDEFRTALNNNLDADDTSKMQREIIADLWLESGFISQEGLDQLETLEPTGQSNPAPIFYLKTRLTQVKPVGQTGDHAQLFFDIEGQSQRAIAFQAASKWPFLKVGVEIELLLAIRANEWQGVRRAQLEVLDARELVEYDDVG